MGKKRFWTCRFVVGLSLTLGTWVVAQPVTENRQLDNERSEDALIVVKGVPFSSWADHAGSNQFRQLGLRCGTIPSYVNMPIMRGGGGQDCTFGLTNPDAIYDPSVVKYKIPVVVHVLRMSNGTTGHISEAMVQSQIDILNEDFLALSGTNGANGSDIQIEFYLATQDPGGAPTNGITYSNNDTWHNDGGTYWDTLAWDTNNYLNIYTNTAGGYLGYVPDLPQGGLAGSNSDRVVILWSSFGRNSPYGPPYNQGRTATHEVGHYLGLIHPFASGGCPSVAGCFTNGDLICETNPQSSPTFGCSDANSCGSTDSIRNYLDYSDDLCMEEFTPEQARRMRCSLEHYRPDLFEISCPDFIRIHVDAAATGTNDGTSWADAFNNLNDALSIISCGEIWVANGTYMPDGGYTPAGGSHVAGSGNRSSTFQLVDGVSIYGGFEGGDSVSVPGGETDLSQRPVDPNTSVTDPLTDSVLSGDIDNDGLLDSENSYHVLFAEKVNFTAVLDGFTITGGRADATSGIDADGGGMHNHLSSPTLIKCTFIANQANAGSGIYNNESSPTITSCNFINNASGLLTSGGGGMWNTSGSNPALNNCTFTGNTSTNAAGGIGNFNSSPTLTNCTFKSNSSATFGGGIFYDNNSNSTMTGCTFIGNTAIDGGGLYVGSGSSVDVVDSTFTSNMAATSPAVGGGAACTVGGTINFTHSSFFLNTALEGEGGGVRVYQGGVSTMMNCLFIGNVARGGGAVSCSDPPSSAVTMVNCTLSQNEGTFLDRGGAVWMGNDATVTILNSVLWGNLGGGSGEIGISHFQNPATLVVEYSDVQGGEAGVLLVDGAGAQTFSTGWIDADPLYVDADGLDNIAGNVDDNLRLLAGSPCIDVGSILAILPDSADLDNDGDTSEPTPFDLDNQCRVADFKVDMGAYETPGVCEGPVLGNDDCANAYDVTVGIYAFDNLLATTDGPDENPICNFFSDTSVESDVWFRYTPSCTGTATVRLCNSDFDTKVAVYPDDVCPLSASAIVCNDDFCGPSPSYQSSVDFSTIAGQPQLIRTGGYNGAQGGGILEITQAGVCVQPPSVLIGEAGFDKDRYVSFDPTVNGANAVATRVMRVGSMTDKYVDCTSLQDLGADGWYATLINGPLPAPSDTTYYCDLSGVTTGLHVRGCSVVPGNTYNVAMSTDGSSFSIDLSIPTTPVPQLREYGDTVGSFVAGAWTAQDGLVTTNDIVAAVKKFSLDSSAAILARLDTESGVPNAVMSSGDILRSVTGFAGQAFGNGVTGCITGVCIPPQAGACE